MQTIFDWCGSTINYGIPLGPSPNPWDFIKRRQRLKADDHAIGL